MTQTNIIFRETQKGPWWIWGIGWAYIALAGYIAWEFQRWGNVLAAWWIIPILMVAMIVFLFLNFTRLKIVITAEFLEVSFGLFHHRIERRKITGLHVLSIGFRETGGLGFRRTGEGLDVWNVRFGPVVRVDSQSQNRPFAFSSDHPDKIIAVLTDKKK